MTCARFKAKIGHSLFKLGPSAASTSAPAQVIRVPQCNASLPANGVDTTEGRKTK